MARPDAAAIGWGVILGGAAVYDVILVWKGHRTLSAAAQDAHLRWPWTTRAAVGVLLLHLGGLLPRRLDPFYLFGLKR